MTGDELDPDRVRAARDVARMHPALVAVVLGVPTVAAVGLVWWLLGPGTAVLMLLAAVLFGGWSMVRKRKR
ncbi:PEP-CTERM sorting domain-containing protein [Mycolicibacterium sphagni]|uniref:PEP-CTERM sorting domain-containing protein n=1 Tax=Mycolicibacterium sphagni TaxID=1786 RepID=A0ABX2JX43_9MYCO|nr:PEP-CTERM sorting domain-containing protein [Mycolicibacterium sphagni]NTY60017.1 PEP-CTERM sorting domain-containing protein [Mycolicibacterium sphagni]